MNQSETTILIVTFIVAAAALYAVWRGRRTAGRLRILRAASSIRCGGVGHIGISVICSDVDNMAQIENLVGPEYDNYEVILCLDSMLSARRMRHIVSRYRLLKVAMPLHNDLPVVGLRAIYRSSHGSMRRITLIDKRFTSHEDALDAAVNIAVFDYVMAVGRDEYLYADAIDLLTAQIGGYRADEIDMLRCRHSGDCVVMRDLAVAHGGYAGMRYMDRSRIRVCNSGIAARYRIEGETNKIMRIAVIISSVVATFIVMAAWSGNTGLATVLSATVALAAACRAYARRCVRRPL